MCSTVYTRTLFKQTATRVLFARMISEPARAWVAAGLATKGGRYRWHIENQGFNRQKHGGFNLEHVYGTKPELLKAYYYLLQTGCVSAHLPGQFLIHLPSVPGHQVSSPPTLNLRPAALPKRMRSPSVPKPPERSIFPAKSQIDENTGFLFCTAGHDAE
jgi:hypothetical protein